MSADEFTKDSHPVNQNEDEDNEYDAAAANYYYQLALMQLEGVEVTEWVGILSATPSFPGRGLNDKENFL